MRTLVLMLGLAALLAGRGRSDELVPPPARPDRKFDQAQDAFDRGVELLRAGEAARAAEVLTLAVNERPEDVDFRCALAAALLQSRKPGAAWHTLDPVSQGASVSPAVEQQRVIIWQALGAAGVFNTGAPASRVVELLGQPDRRTTAGERAVWHYHFMTLHVDPNDTVHSVIDARGFRPELVASANTLDLVLDGRNWTVGHRLANRAQSTVDYVLADQTIQQWQELISVEQLFELSQEGITPERLMQQMQDVAEAQDPPATWQVLRTSTDLVVIHWSVPGLPEGPSQEEVVALIAGPRDLYRVSYRRRDAEISEQEANGWADRWAQARVRQPDDNGELTSSGSGLVNNRYQIWYLGRQVAMIPVLRRQNAPDDMVQALSERVQRAAAELSVALPPLPEHTEPDQQHRATLEWAIRHAGPAVARALERHAGRENSKLFQASMNCHLLTEVYRPDGKNNEAIRGVIARTAQASGLKATLWEPVVRALEEQTPVEEIGLRVQQLHQQAVRALETIPSDVSDDDA